MIDCTVDSTTLIDALRGKQLPHSISVRFSQAGISHVALGELMLGVLKSTNPQELARTVRAIRGMTLLHGDANTAIIYAGIRRDLERQGNMIPQNDIWIAAASIQADVPLISRDPHFRRISQLKLVDY
jgi:tRNA(fMet)-specific endonuclease VapC